MLASADAIVRSVLMQHLRPVSRIDPATWADRHRVVIPPSPVPGRWKTARVPYMREPLMMSVDPRVRRVLLMWATQLGKTEFLINRFLWAVDQDPYPAMWVMHSKEEVREFSAQRIIPTIRATPAVDRHRSGGKWDTKRQTIRFDTMTMNLMGANSPGNLASKPVGLLFLDERDKYPASLRGRGAQEAGATDLAYKRLDAFGSEGKGFEACTPTIEGTGIAAEFQRSDQRHYYVPCPFCDHYQVLRFGSGEAGGEGGVRWEGGSGRELSDVALSVHETCVRNSAWYECEGCRGRIESHHKPRMLERGLWLAAGQRIEKARAKKGKPRGAPVIVGDAPDTDVRGYQLSSLYSPFQPFGFVAAEFVKMRGVLTQDFVNSRLGEPWRIERGASSDEGQIVERAKSAITIVTGKHSVGEHPPDFYLRGTVPQAGLVLVGACDVQEASVFWLLSALGASERLYLVDWGIAPCPEEGGDEATNWAGVEAILRRAYLKVRGGTIPVHTAVIDSGFRTHEVYRAALRMGNGWIIPTKGQAHQTAPASFERLPVEAPAAYSPGAPKGPRTVVASVEMLSLRPDYWKTEAFARLGRTPPATGSIAFPVDAFADESPGSGGGLSLVRHFGAEHRVPIKRRGQVVGFTWEMRPGRKDNHYWDCLVSTVALAAQLGHARMTEENADPVNPAAPGEAPKTVGRAATKLGGRRL